MSESNSSPGRIPLQTYLLALKQGWADGTLTKEEEAFLTTLRKALAISEEEHESVRQEVYLESYLQAIVDVWQDGVFRAEESEKLEQLREQFHISAEDHLMIEKQVRELILKRK